MEPTVVRGASSPSVVVIIHVDAQISAGVAARCSLNDDCLAPTSICRVRSFSWLRLTLAAQKAPPGTELAARATTERFFQTLSSALVRVLVANFPCVCRFARPHEKYTACLIVRASAVADQT